MEELTQGIQLGSTSTLGSLSASGSSSSSTALAATPPLRPSAPPSSSLLGPPPPPSRAGLGGAVADAVAVEGDVVRVLAVGATRRRRLHGVHPSPPSTNRGRGASLCGLSKLPAVSLTRRRPCSLVLLRGFTLRLRGLHLLAPSPGQSVGTRRFWLTTSTPWPQHRMSV